MDLCLIDITKNFYFVIFTFLTQSSIFLHVGHLYTLYSKYMSELTNTKIVIDVGNNLTSTEIGDLVHIN